MKTHMTAVVWIPPESVWAPIQEIRRRHDRHVDRWMPHVTMVYPFVTRNQFSDAKKKLAAVCGRFSPFTVRLSRFEYFKESRTIWLNPEPTDAFRKLQAALQASFPFCDDVSKHPSGFTPHLSVGQGAPELAQELQKSWKPVEFRADQIALIWRKEPPDDAFRIEKTFTLSGPGC
jgi:2'-5' RNA ligase